MMSPLKFRDAALSDLTNDIGCYVLADLDNVPIYVGQSIDGIRSRVRRHLTSARSDIIANRQIDVWEIGFVHAYPVAARSDIAILEAALFFHFDVKSQLMNGSIPKTVVQGFDIPEAEQIICVVDEDDLRERLSPEVRLPRQAQHYARLVDHYLIVKKSDQIARSMHAHFERMRKYHFDLLDKDVV